MTVKPLKYSFWTYTSLDLVIPFIISAFTFIYLVISLFLFCCKRCCDQVGCCKRCCDQVGCCKRCCDQVGCVSDIIYPYTKLVFRRSLKKKESDDSGPTYRFQLRRHTIPKYDVLLLSSLTSWIISLAFFAFWDTFLIQQTHGCDPRLDCFNLNNYRIPKIKPIHNCIHLNATENIFCFEFVFDVVGGFSSAVGVFGISVYYFNMNLTILNWLVRNYDRSFGCKICYVVTAIFVIALPLIIIILCVIMVLNFIDFFDLFHCGLFHYQVLIYCIAFVILAIISTVISCANRVRRRAGYETLN